MSNELELPQDLPGFIDEIRRLFRSAGWVMRSRIVGPVYVGTTETKVKHGLTRVPAGWFAICPDSASSIYQTADPDSTYLYLAASPNVNIKVVTW